MENDIVVALVLTALSRLFLRCRLLQLRRLGSDLWAGGLGCRLWGRIIRFVVLFLSVIMTGLGALFAKVLCGNISAASERASASGGPWCDLLSPSISGSPPAKDLFIVILKIKVLAIENGILPRILSNQPVNRRSFHERPKRNLLAAGSRTKGHP